MKQDLFKSEKTKGNKDKKNKMKPDIWKGPKYMCYDLVHFAKNRSHIRF